MSSVSESLDVLRAGIGVDSGFGVAEQLRQQWPQLAITKALGLEAEQDQPSQPINL